MRENEWEEKEKKKGGGEASEAEVGKTSK